MDQFDVNNVQVQMIMCVHLQKLQRESKTAITYQNLEEYLQDVLWKDGAPVSLSEAADQILRVNASDIVRYLSKKAISEGGKEKLSDFSDLLGGN